MAEIYIVIFSMKPSVDTGKPDHQKPLHQPKEGVSPGSSDRFKKMIGSAEA